MRAQKAIILPTKYEGLYEVAERVGTTYRPLAAYGVMTREHALKIVEKLFGAKVAAAAKKTADDCEV